MFFIVGLQERRWGIALTYKGDFPCKVERILYAQVTALVYSYEVQRRSGTSVTTYLASCRTVHMSSITNDKTCSLLTIRILGLMSYDELLTEKQNQYWGSPILWGPNNICHCSSWQTDEFVQMFHNFSKTQRSEEINHEWMRENPYPVY